MISLSLHLPTSVAILFCCPMVWRLPVDQISTLLCTANFTIFHAFHLFALFGIHALSQSKYTDEIFGIVTTPCHKSTLIRTYNISFSTLFKFSLDPLLSSQLSGRFSYKISSFFLPAFSISFAPTFDSFPPSYSVTMETQIVTQIIYLL